MKSYFYKNSMTLEAGWRKGFKAQKKSASNVRKNKIEGTPILKLAMVKR